jgi:hypothetical protein
VAHSSNLHFTSKRFHFSKFHTKCFQCFLFCPGAGGVHVKTSLSWGGGVINNYVCPEGGVLEKQDVLGLVEVVNDTCPEGGDVRKKMQPTDP